MQIRCEEYLQIGFRKDDRRRVTPLCDDAALLGELSLPRHKEFSYRRQLRDPGSRLADLRAAKLLREKPFAVANLQPVLFYEKRKRYSLQQLAGLILVQMCFRLPAALSRTSI